MMNKLSYIELAQASDSEFRKMMLRREREVEEEASKASETRRRNKELEHQLQVSCIRWFRANPKLRAWEGLLFAIPNGGKREARSFIKRNGVKVTFCPEGKKLKDEGALKGVADLMLAVPAHNYHGLFIEMKIEDKNSRQSEEQKEFEARVKAQGYEYRIVRTLDEFIDLINYYHGKD